MAAYQTPGVYVEEISTLPPSVAEVSTAIPAFIGCTEFGAGVVARIDTLLEYEQRFGVASPSSFTVSTRLDDSTGQNVVDTVQRNDGAAVTPDFLLHYSVSLYFQNGGGSCYVASIGDYKTTPTLDAYKAGLARIEQEDEPTLLVLTDAINLDTRDYYTLCQAALAQCKKLGDRFAILDVKDGDVDGFRNGIGTDALSYGAAYYPYLETTLNYRYDPGSVAITGLTAPASSSDSSPRWQGTFGDNGILVTSTVAGDKAPQVQITKGDATKPVTFTVDSDAGKLTIANAGNRVGNDIVSAWQGFLAAAPTGSGDPAGGFDIRAAGSGSGPVDTTGSGVENLVQTTPPSSGPAATSLDSLRSSRTALYNQIKKALANPRVVLPPSAAIAGIYASVDRDRGVWKAPANASISSIIGPLAKVTHDAQERLNIDPTAGKSINAIRAFTGKGTLVWGARTLAGNDNEWRYISVRRLFIMIEESAKKSTSFAVFEPNDATTWLKVKGMIESYLYGLWERGALQGSTPEQAYFVNVGLGRTMTQQDILEGRMVVEIGIAAVRPAEFIVLRFTHKLAEA